MIKRLGLLSLLLLSPCMAQIPDGSGQLLVVTTPNWSDLHGRAQRYERRGHWFHKVGPSFPVVVGHTGLGWGRGLASGGSANDPVKQEGDGKSPAGVFELGTAFGYETTAVTRLPYLPLTPAIECVDDARSAHYNQLTSAVLNGGGVAKDWSSSEQMRRSDELYHYGVFVKHNTPPVANRGSCIFLHIWESKDIGTVGCTAMDSSDMLMLLAWLDPGRNPLLVQMPAREYRQYRTRWNLPRL